MRFIIFSLFAVLLTSCNLEKRCAKLYPPGVTKESTVKITYRDTTIPGAKVSQVVTMEVIKETPIYQKVIVKDTTDSVELSWYKDAYGNLVMQCEMKDKKLENALVHIADSSKEVITVQKCDKWRTSFVILCIIFLIFGIAHLIIRKL
jgi:hypothetical protein